MRKIYFFFIFCFIATISNQALADCTNPTKPEGTIIYNTDHKVAQFCNGTQWIGMAGGTTSIMTGDTMVDGWPDVIWCNLTNPNWGSIPFHIYHTPHVATGIYYYRANTEDSSNNQWGYNLGFNADKSFNGQGANTFTTTNCDGKTISQLYADGQAFNFVGGGSGGGSDNLGDHTATQDLDMANNVIQNVAGIDLEPVSGGAAPTSGSAATGVPSGFIGAFDLEACPTGWSEYTAARGRFLRGIDPTGTNDPDGVRTAGSLQGDELKSHAHDLKTEYGDYSMSHPAPNGQYNSVSNVDAYINTVSVVPTGGDETRPKNVAVLFCRKD